MEQSQQNEGEASTTRSCKSKSTHYYVKWSVYWLFFAFALPHIFTLWNYTYQFWTKVHKSWLEDFFAAISPYPEYYLGSGAITYDQFIFYTDYNWAMTIHIVPGVIWLICGFIQFNNYIRSNYIKIHRISGYIYFLASFVSIIGSAIILVVQVHASPDDTVLNFTNNGAAHIFLGLYFAAGLISGIGGLYAIKRGEIPKHRQWMVINFFCAVEAVLLRFEWVLLGWIHYGVKMEKVNLIAMQIGGWFGIIVSSFVMSLGDVNNDRGFKRFLTRNVENQRSNKAVASLIAILVINTLFTGVLSGMEYVQGNMAMYEVMGFEVDEYKLNTNTGITMVWFMWLTGSYLNIMLFWFYRFDHNSKFYARHFNKYFIFVSIWNLLTCIVTIANVAVLNEFYDVIIIRECFYKHIEWAWILMVIDVVIMNVSSLYYHFYKKDIERAFEFMSWMIWATAFCFVLRYLYMFIFVGFSRAWYGKDNLQDLIMTGYTSLSEIVLVCGMIWIIIKETQSVKEKNKYEIVQDLDV